MAPSHKEMSFKGTVTRSGFPYTRTATFSVLLVKEDDKWRVDSFTLSE